MSRLMRLYRGIAVQEEAAVSVMEAIRREGLMVEGRFWSGLNVPDLKSRLEDLWQFPDLSLETTRPKDEPLVPRICACVSRWDAMYYACNHNKNGKDKVSIIIAFDVDPAAVVIDGRDFLYTVMQLGNPRASREVLGRMFGPSVLRYADRAWVSKEQSIAYCDLAIQDPDVIEAHAANRLIIGGRSFTRFSSAFMSRAPIAAERIVSVDRTDCTDYVAPEIDIDLNKALGR
jgi:hypothetical protein